MPSVQQGRVVETKTEARAGRTGMGVRWVLGIGTTAIIVIFALLWFGYFA